MIKDIKVEDRKCSQCNSNFEITNFDLEFYEKFSPVFLTKKYSIPTPKLCPDCRQQRRLSFINESNLYKSKCNSCGKNIVSRFNPKSGLNVFCNECWASDERDYFKD
jgi:CxxC-x17-CxxC domain-containing protein